MILTYAIYIGYFLVSCAFVFCFIRLIIGPKMVDRVLAIDTMYINTVNLLVLYCIHTHNKLYFIAAVLIAGIGFAGTIALGKFLLRGNIME